MSHTVESMTDSQQCVRWSVNRLTVYLSTLIPLLYHSYCVDVDARCVVALGIMKLGLFFSGTFEGIYYGSGC